MHRASVRVTGLAAAAAAAVAAVAAALCPGCGPKTVLVEVDPAGLVRVDEAPIGPADAILTQDELVKFLAPRLEQAMRDRTRGLPILAIRFDDPAAGTYDRLHAVLQAAARAGFARFALGDVPVYMGDAPSGDVPPDVPVTSPNYNWRLRTAQDAARLADLPEMPGSAARLACTDEARIDAVIEAVRVLAGRRARTFYFHRRLKWYAGLDGGGGIEVFLREPERDDFAALPQVEQTIIYVVDRSALMRAAFPAAREEILRAVAALHPSQAFHVIFLGDGACAEGPSAGPTWAIAPQKRRAADFIAAQRPFGRTCLAPAVQRAFQHRQRLGGLQGAGRGGEAAACAIRIFSDGGFQDPGESMRMVRQLNADRQVQVSTFRCLAPGGTPGRLDINILRRMAEENGGQYVQIAPGKSGN